MVFWEDALFKAQSCVFGNSVIYQMCCCPRSGELGKCRLNRCHEYAVVRSVRCGGGGAAFAVAFSRALGLAVCERNSAHDALFKNAGGYFRRKMNALRSSGTTWVPVRDLGRWLTGSRVSICCMCSFAACT